MDVFDLLPKLIRASLEYDRKTTESIALMISRKIKKDRPEISAEISKALSFTGYESALARSIDMQTLPVDKESRYSLVNVDEPVEILDPVLDEYTRTQLDDFIREREMLAVFMQEDIVPPNSLLLNGPPGVGKTYIAKWMSYRLNLPLVTLDLASSISSYLGRSGQNIRSIFEYAKSQNSILFLDELDAIAKRRDDAGDLGELKRLVNVLLKELEACPSSCVIIGATNHPELLDKAIWRRFDRTLAISMPDEGARKELLLRHLGKANANIGDEIISYIAKQSKNINAADVCKLSEHIKRQMIMNPETSPKLVALTELFKIVSFSARGEKVELCKMLKSSFPGLTQRDISQITQISLATVSRYLAT